MVRVKRRYLTLEIIPDDPKYEKKNKTFPLNERELMNILRDNIQTIHGDYGVGCINKSLYVKKFCPETRIAVISIQRGPHVFLTTIVPFIKSIKEIKCRLRLVCFSGTLRSSLKNLQKYYKKQNVAFNEILKDLKSDIKFKDEVE